MTKPRYLPARYCRVALSHVNTQCCRAKNLALTSLLAFFICMPVHAKDDTGERLDELEDIVQDLEERVGSRAVASSFDAKKFDIGGFVHTAYTYIEGENRTAKSFNRQNFELLIKAQLNDTWSAFFAGGFLRESDDAFTTNAFNTGTNKAPKFNNRNKTPQIIAWTNYHHSDVFNVRIGRVITPHGIINIEHFPAALLDPEQPQFLRPFGGETIFPNFSIGVQLHGKKFFETSHQGSLAYNAYTANSAANSEQTITGGRVEYNFGKHGISVGANLANGSRSNNADYNVTGLDLLVNKGRLLWKTEYFTTDEDSGNDRTGAYTQPAWRITPEWIVFYRYDFLDNGSAEIVENVIGVNYLPYKNVRLRVVLTNKDFDVDNSTINDTDATIVQLSGTFSF